MEEYKCPPLSSMEEELKNFLLRRPDVRSKIPTASELAEYVSWMAEEYRKPGNIVNLGATEREFAESARDIVSSNPGATARWFEERLVRHSESDFLPAGRDISADIMRRYLPSHWHTSGFFEVYYSLSGNCPIYFRDETVVLHPGALMIVTPSAVRASPCFADDRILAYFLVRTSTFNEIFWSQLEEDNLLTSFLRQALGGKLTTSYIQFDTKNDEEIRDCLKRLYLECHGNERYASKIANSLMNIVFSLLLRRYEGTVRLPRTEEFYWRQEFSALLSYLQTNFATTTIEGLAEHFHYSRRQINRIIQSCMGMSYKELSQKLRMERSQVLLRQGTMTLSEVAQEVGYSSASSFHRAFTRYYDFPPGDIEP